jgi:predicted transcriptional regulator
MKMVFWFLVAYVMRERGERSLSRRRSSLLVFHDMRHVNMTYVMFIYFSTHAYRNSEEQLIIPCEVASKSVVPALKALMVKELLERHSLKQEQAAKLLGISQSAVSKYTKQVRGHAIRIRNMEEVQPLVNSLVDLVVEGNFERTDFLNFFCQACMTVRKTSIMCPFCQKADQQAEIQSCVFCMTHERARVKE